MPAVWGEITAKEILSPISGTMVSGQPETVFSGFSTDSRNIGPGDLFLALKGEQFDGHDFAQKAIEQGAVGVVAQKNHPLKLSHPNDPAIITVDNSLKALGDLASWWRHQHRARVVAITGSSGKTTTKEIIAGILAMGGRTLASQGNYNNLIGLPLTLLRLEKDHQNAALEMGMNQRGEIARLTEIADPDVGAITNVGRAHLEGLGDLKGVARAKVEMVEKISSKGKVVLNGDDKLLMKTAAHYRKNVLTFGLNETNDIRCAEIRNLGQKGSSFRLFYWGGSLDVKLNVPGVQNIFNALAAAAVGLCLHEAPEHIVEGLHNFVGVKGRFTLIHLPEGITLVDDTYNANPSSLKAALESVQTMVHEGGRIIVGLGEMMELGDETIIAHREAGRMVAELGARHLVAMGEHAHEILKGAIESGMSKENTKAVKSHHEMVEIILGEMRKGDMIFLKGSRRMDLGKVVDGIRR